MANKLSKIRFKDKRSEIYQILKVLQSEIDEVEFEKKLVSAINIMLDDDDTKIFGSYFQLNYLKNTKQWAYCFRKSTGNNTNMRLESMHKVIKYFYLNHKKIKRLDKGLHAVLRYIKNKNVERIIKLTKGKNTIYNRDIFKRHKLALQSTFNYTVNNNYVWELSSNKGQKYLILKHSNLSCCKLTCSFCKICVHMYSCDCIDFSGKLTICKHIHFIRNFVDCIQSDDNESKISNNNSLSSDFYFKNVDYVDERDITAKLVSAVNNIDLEASINNTFIKLQNVNLNNLDDNIASKIHSHLNTIQGLIELSNSNPELETFQSKGNTFEASNKNIEHQLRFCSTKKKRKPTSNNKKPDKEQVEHIKNVLNCKPELFISTNCINDHLYL
ncbi:uncharacterized protein LOC126736270 [Anthonomus grandis grandis]|uniref:uncharacterized protein LOC126736270 n=1 Tax=Anthonomus grandis grandis TaxID=2921223 RepID=UPI00216664E5|nr:uncharacterized protein LOC126736270 [Anthonomus grandis grandis]